MDPTDHASAIAPCNSAAVPQLLSEVSAAGLDFISQGHESLASRMELLAKVRQLERALETPREVMIQHVWTQPSTVMAISFGTRTGLWSAMARNGDKPQKVAHLAEQLGMQEELLLRMMRHLAAAGYLDASAPDEYSPNSFTRSMALDIVASGYRVAPPALNPVYLHVHDWLRERNYTCSTGPHDTAYQGAHGTHLSWFDHVRSVPANSQDFDKIMAASLLGRPAWIETYPAGQRLIEGFSPERQHDDNDGPVLFVDVGGGRGHCTEQLLAAFPDAPGRLVVQDLPVVVGEVVDTKGSHPRIERMGYDFFDEQPIKGARAYFTRYVLHDWSDDDCARVVRRIRDAMRPGGYSRLLVHEHVLPDAGPADPEQTGLDLIMLAGFGGRERSAAQWTRLLEARCGLRVEKIWRGDVAGVESVIECVRLE